MKKALIVTSVGLFLLAYLLEAVVEPLSGARLGIRQPYAYFNPAILSLYPFSTAIIFFRVLAIFLIPVLTGLSIEKNHLAKGGGILVLAALMQLYAVQDVATNARVIPLEWSLSLTGAGALLIIPAVVWILQGLLLGAHHTMVSKVRHNIQSGAAEKSPQWMDPDKS